MASSPRVPPSTDSGGTLPVPLHSFVGAWCLERVLGRGGQAVVYLGKRQQDGALAAIKVPLSGNVDRLVREAQALGRLSHPAIVELHSAALSDARPHLVLEYLEAGSLADRLREHKQGLPPEEVMRVARSITGALEYAHEQGVLHRDLKPGNVLFAGGGGCKLGDFGAGKVRQDLELSRDLRTRTRLVGTPTYIAPEIEDARFLTDGAEVDERADLYSLGKLLYTMLTGLPPRTIKPVSRVRPGLDPAWEKLIFSLVEEDRGQRPRNAKAVLFALESIAERLERRLGVRRSIESYQTARSSKDQLDRDSASHLPMQAPHGISSKANSRELTLQVRAFRWSAFLFRLALGLVLLVPVWALFRSDVFNDVIGRWRHAPLVLSVVCLYLALANALNRTSLRIRGNRLDVDHGPLPVRPFRRLPLASIRAYLFTYGIVRSSEEPGAALFGRRNSHERTRLLGYQVGVRTERRRFLNLVSVESYEQASYIVDRLRAYLKQHRPDDYREQVDIADASAGSQL